jgi:hypothetical protein
MDDNFGLGRPMFSAVSPGEYLKSNTSRQKTFKVQRNLEIFIYVWQNLEIFYIYRPNS